MSRSATSADRVADQILLLQQVVEEISGELALEPLLTRIIERACKLIGADDGAIGLYVPEQDAIHTAAAYNIPRTELRPVLARGYGLTGRVLELDAPLRCRYGDLPHPTRLEALDMHMIGMPIRVRGRLIGVFGIGAWPPKRLDADAQDLLEKFARHAAVAIDNARRYAEEQRRASRFALIARVAGIISSGTEIDTLLQRAADAIHELLEYPSVDIPLIEPDDPETLVIRIRGGKYKQRIHHVDYLQMGRGIMGAAAKEKRAVLVNDVASDPRYIKPPNVAIPRAELALPILYRDELLGVVNVEGDGRFDELDRISLEIVAEHLAVAIHNARLFEQTQRLVVLEERQRLARELHDNVTQILSSISLMAQSLPDAWRRNPQDGERRATRVGELSQMAFAEMRALLQELTPTAPRKNGPQDPTRLNLLAGALLEQQGLAAALTRLVSVLVPGNLAFRFDFEGYLPQALAHEQALLRVCQEAVSNVIRHARARRLEISAKVVGERVHMRIADDGHGIASNAGRGMGLANMERRLAELGGSLRVNPRQPTGTIVEAEFLRLDRVLP